MTSRKIVFAMSTTPFTDDGALDETGFRRHLRRLRDAGVGVYLGSPGSGEGYALSEEERRRVFEIGVEELKGRVPVHANPPEPRSAAELIAWMRMAIDVGVDCVELYALDAGHGMRPRPDEQLAYYEDVLRAIDHPIALSIHRAASSWSPSSKLIGQLAKSFSQIRAVHVIAAGSETALQVRDAVPDDVAVYTGTATLLQDLQMGLDGCQAAEGNVCPNLLMGVARDVAAGDMASAGEKMAMILRLYKLSGRWSPSSARWVKMALRVMDEPGGDVRRPYLMPPASEIEVMRAELDRIGILAAEAAERARFAA
ncbi:dihydrodipicolinate synthase family protein [Sphingomonas sp.]|uniref:dihydrodipicolinate synthase family protein n=1 Tax=Sphingomonas sp. TaxID=28214 RepID=UPI002DD689CA|nr:dihydrodipicolinate synthase family protein [Sphingomonas sp.]